MPAVYIDGLEHLDKQLAPKLVWLIETKDSIVGICKDSEAFIHDPTSYVYIVYQSSYRPVEKSVQTALQLNISKLYSQRFIIAHIRPFFIHVHNQITYLDCSSKFLDAIIELLVFVSYQHRHHHK